MTVVLFHSAFSFVEAGVASLLDPHPRVGLLSGGYGPDELKQSGAIRVYEDPADLLNHIDEVGGRR